MSGKRSIVRRYISLRKKTTLFEMRFRCRSDKSLPFFTRCYISENRYHQFHCFLFASRSLSPSRSNVCFFFSATGNEFPIPIPQLFLRRLRHERHIHFLTSYVENIYAASKKYEKAKVFPSPFYCRRLDERTLCVVAAYAYIQYNVANIV